MPRLALHRRRFVGIGLAVLSLIASPWGVNRTLHAQQQGQLFLSVLDASGQPVTDLDPGDVSVMVDDVDCKVVKLEPISRTMKVTLMVDNGSATSNVLSVLRTAVKGFIEAIPDGVQIELLTTAPQPRWLEKFTSDREKLLKAVDRLTPDSGAALFFDALVEAGNRVDKEKGDYFPVFMMLASDVGRNSGAMDREYQKLQQQIIQRAITIHFLMFHSGGTREGSVAGALQTEVGLALTKMSGGRYENIAANTRLASLMPEMAKQIAESNLRQTHQYRITYERPGKDLKPPQKISAGLTKLRIGVAPLLSIDGHIPIGAP
jgi:hypothetical protein